MRYSWRKQKILISTLSDRMLMVQKSVRLGVNGCQSEVLVLESSRLIAKASLLVMILKSLSLFTCS